MKAIPQHRQTVAALSASIALCFAIDLGVHPADAADRTWNGGGSDDNWTTPANWGGTAPAAGDSLLFGGSVRTSPINNFPIGTLFNGVTFNNPAGAFTLSGNRITLGGNIVDSMPLVPETINLPLTLNASRNVDVVADGLLTIAGVISGPGFGLTKTGAGQLTLSASNTFGGPVAIDAGTLSVASDANLGAAPSAVTAGAIVINGGALRTTSSFALNPNRGILLGPATGTGAGTFNINSGTTLTYGGIIANNSSGAGGLTKISFGGLTLSGVNSYTGPTSIKNGTMTLDFTQTFSPLNNIISPSSALSLGGANAGLGTASFAALTMDGKGGATDSQAFNGTTIDIGPAIIRANSSGGGAANMVLGALTHNPGGIANIITPTANGGAGRISTTATNIQAILGGWATVGNGGVFNNITMGTDWASVDANGNIVAYNDYKIYATGDLLEDTAKGANLRINGSSTGDVTVNTPGAGTTTDVNTINLSETRAFSLVIGDGNTLRLGRFGSIFKSDNANNITWALGSGTTGGANGIQDQGTLTAGGAPDTPGEIVFYMNNGTSQSQGSLNLEARITDNGSGAVTVVKAGPSSMKLRGHNTFSGGLYLLQGRLQFAGGEIGTPNPDGGGTGPIVVMPGAYLFPSGAGSVLTNSFFVAGVGTQQEPVGAIRFGNGWSISGDLTLLGDTRLGGGNAATVATTGVGGKISGPFNLDLGARQTINSFFTLSNPSNDWTGTTTLNARNTATANVIRNGASEVIPNGVGKGNVVIDGNTSTGTITWDLNGFSETINGLLSAGNLAGCIIINNAAATASTLTVGDYDQTATFGGVIQDGAALATVGLTKIGGGRQTLTGANTYTGPTTVNGGTLALSGSGSIATSQRIFVEGAAFDISGITGAFSPVGPVGISNGTFVVRATGTPGISSFSLTNSRVSVASLASGPAVVEAVILTTGGNTNFVDIASVGAITSYPVQFTIIKYTGLIEGNGFNFGLGNVPSPSTRGYVSNNVLNSSVDLVLLDGPKALTWTGIAGNAWDIESSTNWVTFAGTPIAYVDVDSVRFDDTARTNIVNLTTTLRPGSIAVSNQTLNYTFTGAGKLTGSAGLTKDGPGLLVLDNSGTNDFLGPIAINTGTVQVGNGGASGNLGLGSVANSGALTFARNDTHTVANIISGTGTVTQNSAGIVVLSGDNVFTGPAVISQGTLRPGSATALGAIDSGTTVSPGATLDVNGQNLGAEPVTVFGAGVGGNGVIINTGPAQVNALRVVTLAGDTTFGGTERWDIRSVGGAGSLSTDGNAYKITKVGPNQVSLVGLPTVDPALGDIDIREGVFSVQTTTVQLGDSTRTITVHSNATLNLFNLNPNPLDKMVVLRDGATLWNENGDSTVSGPITLQGRSTFNAASAGTSPALTIAGEISGAGSLVKVGAGILTLASAFNGYSGTTTVSNGTLFVDGSDLDAGTFTVYNGILGGTGSLTAPVIITANGRLSPGNLNNTLSSFRINHAVTLGGTNVMDLDKTGGSLTSDSILDITTLTLSGTLQLNITGEALALGDTFKLYGFTSANGAFAAIVPATPGPDLAWDTSRLRIDGTLRVGSPAPSQPRVGNIALSGPDVVISGTGGPAGGTYHVLSSTNIVLPVTNWTSLATNLFDGSGNFNFTNAVDRSIPQRFFLLRLQ